MRFEDKFRGPPNSAHGGVAVGRFAELVGHGPAQVRLLGPPPLETDLDTRTERDGAIIVSGPSGDVAHVSARDEPVVVEPFSLVTDTELDSAEAEYLRVAEQKGHPFPTCYGCGPEREVGDGLRQFPGPLSNGGTVGARFAVDGDDLLPSWMGWAGLDCPSGHAVNLGDDPPPVVVLGTMSGQVEAPVRAGVDYQVRARLVSSEGRKHTTEVAMLAQDGTAVAAARAVWIAIDPGRF